MKDNFLKGFFKENPLFTMLLGCCPALAVTTTVENAIGMTLAFTFVVVLSNLFISLININEKIKELIQPVRIAVYIVIIATLVTVVEMLMEAYFPSLYSSLGVFISLITVNCIVLGRAEAYASKNKPLNSIVDGLSMGLGYGMAIIMIAFLREVLGAGSITIWGSAKLSLIPVFNFLRIEPISFFVSSPGAFLVLGLILGVIQAINNKKVLKNKNKRQSKKEVK